MFLLFSSLFKKINKWFLLKKLLPILECTIGIRVRTANSGTNAKLCLGLRSWGTWSLMTREGCRALNISRLPTLFPPPPWGGSCEEETTTHPYFLLFWWVIERVEEGPLQLHFNSPYQATIHKAEQKENVSISSRINNWNWSWEEGTGGNRR